MKQARLHFGIGISSILMIFFILCIVTFAVLSYVSARADSSLSEDVLTNTSAYYEANSRAEKKLSEIDRQLGELSLREARAYFAGDASCRILPEQTAGNGFFISFSEEISPTQDLDITLRITGKESTAPCYYEVTQWKKVNTAEWTPDNDITLLA